MKRFYEAYGKTRKEILAVLDEREEELAKALELATEIGAETIVHAEARVIGFAEFKTPPSDNLLRLHYNRRKREYEAWFSPNRKTKEGRELAKRMANFFLSTGVEIAKAARLPIWSGMHMLTPGVRVWGPRKRVILVSHDKISTDNPELERISDLEFERLETKYEPVKPKKAKEI